MNINNRNDYFSLEYKIEQYKCDNVPLSNIIRILSMGISDIIMRQDKATRITNIYNKI